MDKVQVVSNPEEGNDVWVHQVFPLDKLLKEELSVKSIGQVRKITELTRYPLGERPIRKGGRFDFLDVNFRAVQRPFIDGFV